VPECPNFVIGQHATADSLDAAATQSSARVNVDHAGVNAEAVDHAYERLHAVRERLLAIGDEAFDQLDHVGAADFVIAPVCPSRQNVLA
jgi:hypothetical protein